MEHTHQSIEVTVRLPVSFHADRNGHDVTIYQVRVAGMSSIFEYLPDDVRAQINDQIAAKVRGIR